MFLNLLHIEYQNFRSTGKSEDIFGYMWSSSFAGVGVGFPFGFGGSVGMVRVQGWTIQSACESPRKESSTEAHITVVRLCMCVCDMDRNCHDKSCPFFPEKTEF